MKLPDWTPVTFEDLACYWIIVHASTHKSMSSIKRDQGILRNYLLPPFGSMSLDTITVRHVDQWFCQLKQESRLSGKSCNDVLGLFRKICNDGERWEFLEKNPVAKIKKIRLPEQDYTFWSLAQAQQYLGYWAMQPHKPRIYYCVVLALYTGMRRGEVLGLQWDSVNYEAGMITVKRTYCRVAKAFLEETKSKKIRRIPICKALSSHLRDWYRITGSSGYVVPLFHPDHFIREFNRTALTARVPQIQFKNLRHTFASHFLMGGGNIYDLQKILGHSTVQMTERYVHLIPSHLQGKTEVLGF